VLHDREIHVWRHRLLPPAPDLARLRSLLRDDELERVRRFKFDIDRSRFIISRGTLRTLLGAYLQVPAENLRFEYSSYGRPFLTGPTTATRLDFNVSHSGSVTLWAFAIDRRIGVDVERVRTDFGAMEIAERFFSESERHEMSKLSVGERHQAFFRCWTRKESFIKALGEGLSHPLDRFDVTLASGEPTKLLATRPLASDAERWAMFDVSVADGYCASLTAELI
jgi:4'-phosphopantetheinyl transferase